MSDQLKVTEEASLLLFLYQRLDTWARSKVKQRLQSGCVTVNGVSVRQHDFALHLGDTVVVLAAAKSVTNSVAQLEILYSDRDIVAINKPAGLLSVGNDKETQQHALALLRNQLSRPSKPVKLWPVNRLDRDTSGVQLFATSHEMREAVMANWNQAEKIYLAIVKGHPNPAAGTIDQPLRLDEVKYQMHVGPHPDAKPAITHFATERTTTSRALLRVKLATGRQHQIRAHLSWLGYPVIGDERYGTSNDQTGDGRMGLHALSLQINKPGSHKPLKFEAPAPANFWALFSKS